MLYGEWRGSRKAKRALYEEGDFREAQAQQISIRQGRSWRSRQDKGSWLVLWLSETKTTKSILRTTIVFGVKFIRLQKERVILLEVQIDVDTPKCFFYITLFLD